jgi:hypothetical protein
VVRVGVVDVEVELPADPKVAFGSFLAAVL